MGPGLIFPKKMSLQQLWRNVNLGLRASNRQQWNYITFFLNLFYRNIIGIYLNVLSLFWCKIVKIL